jgi:hypothetical protein
MIFVLWLECRIMPVGIPRRITYGITTIKNIG